MVAEFFVIVVIIGAIAWAFHSIGSVRDMNVGARLVQEKRYAEAEAHFKHLLAKRLPPGVEASTRRDLASTLDILGKTTEAAQERELASVVAMGSKSDPTALAIQGDLLRRQNRYDEACEIYQRALGMLSLSPATSSERGLMMAKLATTHQKAGRPEETLKWAKASLANNPDASIHRSMESMSGVASSDQGDLEGAQSHYSRALRLAEAEGKPQQISQGLATLAGIQHKRGQFLEAIAAARRAVEICDSPIRHGYIVEATCLSEIGQFDEARAVLARMRQAPYHDQPDLERYTQAVHALVAARIEIRADKPEAALILLEQAREGFAATPDPETLWPPAPKRGNDRMVLWCDAAKTVVLAQQGEVNASRVTRGHVLNRAAHFADDRTTQLNVYSSLGRAAFILGDLAECLGLFRFYLDCKPHPVGLPPTFYWLGETHLRLGETDAAREAFRQAVAPGIDSLDARRAQMRLQEMGG